MPYPTTPQEDLLKDMRQVLYLGEHSDVTVKCGSREWEVHAAILTTRSTFFRAALRRNWKEANTRVIEYPEEDPDVVDCMLQFIYTANYDLDKLDTRGLLEMEALEVAILHCQIALAGEKYGINGLLPFARKIAKCLL